MTGIRFLSIIGPYAQKIVLVERINAVLDCEMAVSRARNVLARC